MTSTPNLVHIIGIGNLTRMDDGVAIHIIQKLLLRNYPETIKITDLGTGGVDIALMLDGWTYGIIIDAVKIEGKRPGEIVEFIVQDEILPDVTGLSSTHGFDALSSLKLAYAVQEFQLPKEIIIIGIQIDTMNDFGTELSPLILEAIPKVITRVDALLNEYQK
ncbi:MAG: hydrogenase maturation protease [Candidatus Heimdallarchaeota archaeon]